MLKTRVSFVIGALLASGLCLAEDTKPPAKAAAAAPAPLPGNTTFATINGVTYPLAMYQMLLLERSQGVQIRSDEDLKQLQQQAFEDLRTMAIGSQEAQKRKLQDTPNVIAAIETAAQVQRLKILSNAAFAAMAQDFKITDEEMKKVYEDAKKGPAATEYRARHILLKDEAEAKKIIKELDKGADFSELAKKRSESSTAKNDGGQLDWFDGNSNLPIVDAVVKMKVGTYSKEPVQTQYGWHVINLQETRLAPTASFEDLKPNIVAYLQRQKLEEQVGKMRQDATVQLNEEVAKANRKTDTPTSEPAKKDEVKK